MSHNFQQCIEYYEQVIEEAKTDIDNYKAEINWDWTLYDTLQTMQDALEDDMIMNGVEEADGKISELSWLIVKRNRVLIKIINNTRMKKREQENLRNYKLSLAHYKLLHNGWECYFRGNVRCYYLPDSDDDE